MILSVFCCLPRHARIDCVGLGFARTRTSIRWYESVLGIGVHRGLRMSSRAVGVSVGHDRDAVEFSGERLPACLDLKGWKAVKELERSCTF